MKNLSGGPWLFTSIGDSCTVQKNSSVAPAAELNCTKAHFSSIYNHLSHSVIKSDTQEPWGAQQQVFLGQKWAKGQQVEKMMALDIDYN